MGDVKLLPCPWCTEAALIVKRKRYRKYVVLCDNIDCVVRPSTPECDAEADAIAAWNRRALTPAQQAAEEMVEALEKAKEFTQDELENRTSSFGVPQEDGTYDVSGLAGPERSYVTDADDTLNVINAALAKAGKP